MRSPSGRQLGQRLVERRSGTRQILLMQDRCRRAASACRSRSGGFRQTGLPSSRKSSERSHGIRDLPPVRPSAKRHRDMPCCHRDDRKCSARSMATEPSRCIPPSFGKTLGVQQAMGLEPLHAFRLRLGGFFGEVVLARDLLADLGKLFSTVCSNSFSSERGFAALRGLSALRLPSSALHFSTTSADPISSPRCRAGSSILIRKRCDPVCLSNQP